MNTCQKTACFNITWQPTEPTNSGDIILYIYSAYISILPFRTENLSKLTPSPGSPDFWKHKEQIYNCQHILRFGALLPRSLLLKKSSRVGWNCSDASASTSCSWSWYDYDTIRHISREHFKAFKNNSWMKHAIWLTSNHRGTSNGSSKWNPKPRTRLELRSAVAYSLCHW